LKVPVIDFQQVDAEQIISSSALTVQVDKALSQIEIMSSTNLGIDSQMLERWTNGRYRSTSHRVKPKIGHRERYSIAVFVDPDSAAPVAMLESCVSDENPAKYSPITASEHLRHRIQASHPENVGQ
jgi:isopenicillin N synthase-like dioxygenase